MSERCWTVRGYVTAADEVLLKVAPAHAAGHWLADDLAAQADQEVLITVSYQVIGRSNWAPSAMQRLEQPPMAPSLTSPARRALPAPSPPLARRGHPAPPDHPWRRGLGKEASSGR